MTEGGEPELHGRGKVDDPTSPTSDRDHPHLTCRECDVVSKLRECKPNKIIAHELGMSISTVKVHIRNIMRKLGATNRMQVALMSDVSGHPHHRVELSTNS